MELIIGGTRFLFNKAHNELVQCDKPANKIKMDLIWEDNPWTQFFYDSRIKNVYNDGFVNGERPAYVQLVLIPSLPYREKLSSQKTTALLQHQRNHKKGRSL